MLGEPLLSSREDTGGFVPGTGPLFIAYLFSWLLYGVLSIQAYVFYLAFPNEQRLRKWLVATVYFLETADIAIMTSDALADFRGSFGLSAPAPSRRGSSPMQFSWLRMYILGGITICIVQCHYAYHLYSLRQPRVLVGAIILTAFAQCGAGMVAGAFQSRFNFYTMATQTKVPAEIYAFGITSTVSAIMVTTTMVQQLLWRDTEWMSRHPLIPKAARLLVETGAVAATVAVTYLILFFCNVHSLNLIIPALVLSKIYANSLLLVLNSRMELTRGRIKLPEHTTSLVFPKTRTQVFEARTSESHYLEDVPTRPSEESGEPSKYETSSRAEGGSNAVAIAL